MKRNWSTKRIVLAAAAVVVLSVGVAAVSGLGGFIRSDWKTTRALKDAQAVEDVLRSGDAEGISAEAKFLEDYCNGFTFVKGTLEGYKGRADGDPTEYRYQSVSSWYERDGALVYVDVSPVLPGITDKFNGQQVDCEDVTLYTLERDFLVVPKEYEKTPEQKEAEAAGSLMISYDDGLTEPEAMVQRYVSWLQDGVRYSITALDSKTELSELIAMAKELIGS